MRHLVLEDSEKRRLESPRLDLQIKIVECYRVGHIVLGWFKSCSKLALTRFC